MTTFRKMYQGIYTEVKRIVNGQVKQTCCCCKGAGLTRRECANVSGNKTPCRCYCHDKKN
jgi:hypothetical protein